MCKPPIMVALVHRLSSTIRIPKDVLCDYSHLSNVSSDTIRKVPRCVAIGGDTSSNEADLDTF